MAGPASARAMIAAMEIEERGWTPDTPTPKTPSPISATGAQPLLVEAKRCEAKAPPKKFNTQARMSVGGKGLQWCNEKLAQAQRVVVVISSDEDEGEKRQDKKPPAPRRSLRLLGVKRKNYIEHTPEPKDYAGDSDWESIMSPVHGVPPVVTTMMIGRGGPKRREGKNTTPPEVIAARRRRTTTSPRMTAPTAAGITPGAVSSAAMKSRISAPPLIGATIESWQWIEGWTTSRAWPKEITTSFSAT